MACKSVVLNIICFKIPCCLTVMAQDGTIIKNVQLESYNSKICFNTTKQSLKLMVTYNNMTEKKKICVDNLCKNNCFKFDFSSKIFQQNDFMIKLYDFNYGFPVDKAILNFTPLS